MADSQVATGSRARLTLASIAVAFAAADTYVVVLALPDMMAGVGLSADQLQRAAPIVSGLHIRLAQGNLSQSNVEVAPSK